VARWASKPQAAQRWRWPARAARPRPSRIWRALLGQSARGVSSSSSAADRLGWSRSEYQQGDVPGRVPSSVARARSRSMPGAWRNMATRAARAARLSGGLGAGGVARRPGGEGLEVALAQAAHTASAASLACLDQALGHATAGRGGLGGLGWALSSSALAVAPSPLASASSASSHW
jgi:hypothetical protein